MTYQSNSARQQAERERMEAFRREIGAKIDAELARDPNAFKPQEGGLKPLNLWGEAQPYRSTASDRGRFYHAGSLPPRSGAFRVFPKQLRARMMWLCEEAARVMRKNETPRALTRTAVDVFRALLFTFWNSKTGRCDPAYETLADAAGCSRSAVHLALAQLEFWGFIERERRAVDEIGPDGIRRRRQISNAYRLDVGRKCLALLGDAGQRLAGLWQGWVEGFSAMIGDVKKFWGAESNSWTETSSLFSNNWDKTLYDISLIEDEGLRHVCERWAGAFAPERTASA